MFVEFSNVTVYTIFIDFHVIKLLQCLFYNKFVYFVDKLIKKLVLILANNFFSNIYFYYPIYVFFIILMLFLTR